ncbi:hypothetical protein [Roseofilum sp. Guam]|uniref:hypothetical protein n=1 Tax=Roseofilum sp. Guam TaxID=2821502 RepID=UPI001B127EA3|nr:hypothetical protein [Roseofilum sp. Guam]MBP0026957.1 hypothetical protein [Roseofilum sp. Guam]
MALSQPRLNRQLRHPIHRQSPLKKQRWYAGFKYRGKPEKLIKIISDKVKKFELNKILLLVRLEKKPAKYFYFFIAIESELPGIIPEKLKLHLKGLPCFKNPAVKGKNSFTYEEIKSMVGEVHKVQDYTNPIPYNVQKSANLHSDPFGFVSDFKANDAPSSPNLDRLLDYLSCQGNGTWKSCQNICQNLGIEEPKRVLRNLKLLGHLGISKNGKKWAIAPTSLIPLNHHPDNLEFILCGQQNSRLRQQLGQYGEVKPEGQPVVFGLPRFKVILKNRTAYEQLDTLCGVKIHKPGNLAQQVADSLPTLREWQNQLPISGGIVSTQYEWKKFEDGNFRECSLPDETGFYEMRRDRDRSYLDRTLFYEANTQQWKEGDWYGLRLLSLYHSHALRQCYYKQQQKQLAILYEQRWPQLYEQALVLASGYLPQFSTDHKWLRYHNITPELAQSLTEKLELTCGGL